MKTSKYVEELKLKVSCRLSRRVSSSAKKELFNLRFQNATNQLDNTGRIKEVRKRILQEFRRSSLRKKKLQNRSK